MEFQNIEYFGFQIIHVGRSNLNTEMNRFYFDTSALNHLLDDNTVEASSVSDKKVNISFSVFTVAEVASTPDLARRNSLLQLAKELSGGYRPLAFPAELLKRSIESIKTWAPDMDSSMSHEWDGICMILNDPSLIDDKTFQEIKEWKNNQENWFHEMHERGRPHLQNALTNSRQGIKDSIFNSFARLLRYHSPDKKSSKEFVFDLASQAKPNITIDNELVDRLLKHSEHWRFFLSSMIYGLYAHSVRNSHYSRSQNPGSIDTQQAIYLAACDVFVTADLKQREMLRLLVPLGHKRRQVWEYQTFAEWIKN
jgi:hypothetical protein